MKPSARATILNVDDAPATRFILTKLLRQAGFDVLEGASGEEALRFATRHPDLVILDVNLPDMDGFAVCRQLKADAATAMIPVVMVSAAHIETADRIMGLEGGAEAYLTHPIDPAVLVATVRALVRLRRAEQHMRDSQKMEAIGRLAGGIAHDFNNLLTALIGNTDLVLGAVDEGAAFRKDIEEVRRIGVRAASLTRQLLAFSRKQTLATKVVDLNGVVRSIGALLQRLIGEDVELRYALCPYIGSVRADPGQLDQVVLNLAVNGRDAMPDGGSLTISTEVAEVDDETARRLGDIRPGRHIVLSFADSGTGMDAATLSRLFEPFFTTKELGRGTGLGLSLVYGIVRQNGGAIDVESALGAGTTFRVYLPLAGAQAEVVEAETRSGTPGRGSETVLVVEDDDLVRDLAARVLREAGYQVLEARNGPEALETADANLRRVHVLVADQIMPLMSGSALATRLRALIPTLRVVHISGYAGQAAATAAENGGAFLEKPFTPEALLRAVREALDAAPDASGVGSSLRSAHVA